MNIDYTRCLILAPEKHPETAACRATGTMLERLGAGEIQVDRSRHHDAYKSLKPTYIADFGALYAVTAIEWILHTEEPLTIEVFDPRIGDWGSFMPRYGQWTLNSYQWLYEKMKVGGASWYRSGSNAQEYLGMTRNKGEQKILVHLEYFEGPCG